MNDGTSAGQLNPPFGDIPPHWDIIIVGGGITGAGIFREAVRAGFRTILLEEFDFSWGTSSRSSKLVHGGLRYLREGKFFLTKASVEERQRLLREAPGLVEPLGFLLPLYEGRHPGRTILTAGLSLYDMMGSGKKHRFLEWEEFITLMPHLRREGLTGGFSFYDAQVDDARLVLRLISEAVQNGGWAVNYTPVRALLRDDMNRVTGVACESIEDGTTGELRAPVVINATGCRAEELHPSPERHRHLRPLRGSHIVLPSWTLPLPQAITFMHPQDGRPIFVIPWEGTILVGTTDLDHHDDLGKEPTMSPGEAAYLMEGLADCFPALSLRLDQTLCSFAGVRPVVSEGNRPPSEESRDHVIWTDNGLVTVTGGKLTTFRRLAWDAMKEAFRFIPGGGSIDRESPIFEPVRTVPRGGSLRDAAVRRLFGRYGRKAAVLLEQASQDDLETLLGTNVLWIEVVEGAREGIRRLDDLLLRRVRLGLLRADGGIELLDDIEKRCGPSMKWDRRRWKEERKRYREILELSYGVPGRAPRPEAVKEGFLEKGIGRIRKVLRPGRQRS